MQTKTLPLKHVLIIPFILLMSVTVLITSFLTWSYHKKTTKHFGNQISEQSAFRLKENLDFYLNTAKESNQLLRQMLQYGFLDINNRKEVLEYILYTVQQHPHFSTLSIAYPDGTYMGISNTQNGNMLKKIASPETERVFYSYDLTTNQVIQQRADYDARLRPWFKEAKASTQPIWSSVFQMYSNNKLGITYAEAIKSEGEFKGVIGTDIVFHDLNQRLDDTRLTEHAYLFIIDEKDNILAQSNLTEKQKTQKFFTTFSKSNNPLLKQSLKFIYQHTNNKNESFHGHTDFEINQETEGYFISFIPYGNQEGLDWHIGVVIPESDFLGAIKEIRKYTLLIWFICFIVAMALGLIITYLITRAFNQLYADLYHIEKTGYLYEHKRSHNIKEINVLSISFARMSKRVHESYLDINHTYQALENVVKERTNHLEKSNDKLRKVSNTDPLTHLANRRSFDHCLKLYWKNLVNHRMHTLSILELDIDFFKQYNDTYGHPQGDECLKSFANVLQESISDKHIACRLGGEEFMIILPDSDSNDAKQLAENIANNLADRKIEHKQSKVCDYVTVSIGIACITATELANNNIDAEAFVGLADKALYKAKNNGRNRYVVYEDD